MSGIQAENGERPSAVRERMTLKQLDDMVAFFSCYMSEDEFKKLRFIDAVQCWRQELLKRKQQKNPPGGKAWKHYADRDGCIRVTITKSK